MVEALDRIGKLEESRTRIGRQWSELVERMEVLEHAVAALERRLGMVTKAERKL
jgi:hypothetical protein